MEVQQKKSTVKGLNPGVLGPIQDYVHQDDQTQAIFEKKSRKTVIAGSRILAHLKENIMCGTLSIKQRSSPHCQEKPTSDFATQHLKTITEITHALSETNDTKM